MNSISGADHWPYGWVDSSAQFQTHVAHPQVWVLCLAVSHLHDRRKNPFQSCYFQPYPRSSFGPDVELSVSSFQSLWETQVTILLPCSYHCSCPDSSSPPPVTATVAARAPTGSRCYIQIWMIRRGFFFFSTEGSNIKEWVACRGTTMLARKPTETQQQSCYCPRFDKTRGRRGDLSLEGGCPTEQVPLGEV